MKTLNTYIDDSGNQYDITDDQTNDFIGKVPSARRLHLYQDENGNSYSITDDQAEEFAKSVPGAVPVRRLSKADGSTAELRLDRKGIREFDRKFETDESFKADREERDALVKQRIGDDPSVAGMIARGFTTSVEEGVKGGARALKNEGAALLGIATGAIRLLGTGAKAVGSAVGSDSTSNAGSWLYDLANSIDEGYDEIGRDELASIYSSKNEKTGRYETDDWGANLADAAGSSAGGIMAFIAAGAAGPAGNALMVANAANDSAVSAYDKAIERGATHKEAMEWASLSGVINGAGTIAMMKLPVSKWLKSHNIGADKLPKGLDKIVSSTFKDINGGTFTGQVAGQVAGATKRSLMNGLVSAGESSGIMGVQSFLGSLANQGAEKGADNIDVGEAAKEGAKSFGEGLLIGGAMEGIHAYGYSAKRAEKYIQDLEKKGGAAAAMRAASDYGSLGIRPETIALQHKMAVMYAEATPAGRDIILKNSPSGMRGFFRACKEGRDITPEIADKAGLPVDLSQEQYNSIFRDYVDDHNKSTADREWRKFERNEEASANADAEKVASDLERSDAEAHAERQSELEDVFGADYLTEAASANEGIDRYLWNECLEKHGGDVLLADREFKEAMAVRRDAALEDMMADHRNEGMRKQHDADLLVQSFADEYQAFLEKAHLKDGDDAHRFFFNYYMATVRKNESATGFAKDLNKPGVKPDPSKMGDVEIPSARVEDKAVPEAKPTESAAPVEPVADAVKETPKQVKETPKKTKETPKETPKEDGEATEPTNASQEKRERPVLRTAEEKKAIARFRKDGDVEALRKVLGDKEPGFFDSYDNYVRGETRKEFIDEGKRKLADHLEFGVKEAPKSPLDEITPSKPDVTPARPKTEAEMISSDDPGYNYWLNNEYSIPLRDTEGNRITYNSLIKNGKIDPATGKRIKPGEVKPEAQKPVNVEKPVETKPVEKKAKAKKAVEKKPEVSDDPVEASRSYANEELSKVESYSGIPMGDAVPDVSKLGEGDARRLGDAFNKARNALEIARDLEEQLAKKPGDKALRKRYEESQEKGDEWLAEAQDLAQDLKDKQNGNGKTLAQFAEEMKQEKPVPVPKKAEKPIEEKAANVKPEEEQVVAKQDAPVKETAPVAEPAKPTASDAMPLKEAFSIIKGGSGKSLPELKKMRDMWSKSADPRAAERVRALDAIISAKDGTASKVPDWVQRLSKEKRAEYDALVKAGDQEALSDFRVANDKTVRKGYDPDVRQSRKESEIRSDIELVGSDNISEVAKKRDIMMMYAGDPRWQPKIDAANRLVKDYIDERWRRTVGYSRGDKKLVKEAVDVIKRLAPDFNVKVVDEINDGDGNGKNGSYADLDIPTNTITIYGDAGIRDVMHDVGWHVMRRWAEINSPEMLAKLNEYAESAPASIREYVDRVYADFKGDNNAFLDELGAIRWERQFSGDLAEALRDRNNRSWLKKFGDAVKNLYVDAARKMGVDVGNIDVENALKTMNANEFVDFMASEVVKGHRLSNGIKERVKDGARTIEASPAADGEPVVEVDGKRYSYKSMRHDLDEGHMVDELIRTKVFADKKEAKKWVSKVNKLMDALEPRLDILDMNETVGREDRGFSPYKDNSDDLYEISLDFSTLCKKRIFTQKVIDKLQSEVKKDFLTRDEQIAVRDMLKEYQKIDKDLQVACHLCYVEAARLKAPEQQLKLFNEPGKLRGEFVNYMALKNGKELGENFQREWKIKHGYPADATKKEIDRLAKERGTPKSDVMNAESSEYRKANYKLSPAEEAIYSRLVEMGKEPFLDSAKLTKLAHTDKDIFDFYSTFVRNTTKSKGLEPDVPYYFGDSKALSKGFIKKMNEQGTGLRHQSWSDFQVTHLLDTVTALADLATRGAKMHCYTKVPEFVEIFGKSGIMYNLSLIPEKVNGKWTFSPVEGMPYETAMKLRRKNHETVGTIAIAADYGHLRQLLKNASIDYVIPYHSSGMPIDVRNMAGIGEWKDFQSIQHTKPNKDIATPERKPADWHKEPAVSEWVVDEGKGGIVTMQDSAKRYVDLCNERGLRPKFAEVDGLMKKNADGTYTLLDKNYWKLIVDHKMIDGKNRLIEQKPVRPEFDLAAAKRAIAKEIGTYDESRFDRAYDYVRKQYDTIDERIANLKDSGKIDKIIEGIKKAKRHSMKDDGPDDPNDDGPGGGKRLINKDGKGIIQPYGNSISERGRFIEDGGKIYPTTVNRSEESRVLSSEDVFGREYKKSVTPEFRIEEDVVYDSEKFQKVYNSLNGDLQSKKIADRVFELGSRLGLKYTIGDIDGGLDGVEISGGHIMYDINGLTDWRYTPQDKANTILHEAIHGITTYAINIAEGSAKAPKDVDVNGKLKKAVKELNDVFKRSLQYTNGFQNGRSNASEFIAELANPAFRNRLKKASIFTSVVNAIKNIFKAISGKFNLNDEALANLDKFIDNVDEFAFDAQRHYSRVKNSKAGIDNLFYPEKSIVRHSKKDTESEGGIALDWTKEAESFGEKARRNMQDHMLPVSRMEKKLGITDKEESFYHAKDRAFGRNDHEMRVLEKSVVKPMLSEISKAGVSYGRVWDSSNPNSKVGLDDYLYAMHAKERNAVLNNRDGNAVDGSGMSDATADAILNSFAKMPAAERKVIEDAAKAVWKMNDEGLTRRVDSGRMSQAEADALRRQFKHYVPLRTNMEADGNDLFNNGTAGFGKHEFHKALGRTSEADSPLVFSLMQAKDSILGSNKNMARGKLLDIVQNHDGLADVWKFDKASNHWLKIERDPSGNDIVVDKKSARFFSPNEADMNDIVLAKKNGDLYAMQFYNEQGNLIARAATDKGVMNFNSKFEFVQQLTRKMAEMRTQLVPTFTIRNLVTDHNEAFLNAIGDRGIIGAAKFFGRMEKYFWDREAYKAKKLYFNDGKFNDGPSATETDKLFKEYVTNGGLIGGGRRMGYGEQAAEFDDIINSAKRGVINPKRILGKLGDVMTTLNEQVEVGTRFAVYRACRAEGMSVADAVSYSRDLTTNFNRKGEYTPVTNSLYMFSNAAIQGLARALKSVNVKGPNAAKAWEAIAFMTVLGSAQALWAHFMNDDEDRKRKGESVASYTSEHNKQNSAEFGYNGMTVHGKIRYPWAVPMYTARKITELFLGDTNVKDAVDNLGDGVIVSMLQEPVGHGGTAFQTVLPSILVPAGQIVEGKDFRGQDLYRKNYVEEMPDSENGRKATGSFYKSVAKGINSATGGNQGRKGYVDVAPETIKVIAETLGGGIMTDTAKVLNLFSRIKDTIVDDDVQVSFRDIPFVADVFRENAPVDGKYYETLNKVTADKYEYKTLSGKDRNRFLAKNRHVENARMKALEGEIKDLSHREDGEVKDGTKYKPANLSYSVKKMAGEMKRRKMAEYIKLYEKLAR